jgi:hypothetical protein
MSTSKFNAPHGPRLALSKVLKSSSLCSDRRNQSHLCWLRASATASDKELFAAVARTDITALSYITLCQQVANAVKIGFSHRYAVAPFWCRVRIVFSQDDDESD